MSRYYEMTVTVEGFDAKNASAVLDAMCEHWNFTRSDCWVADKGPRPKLGGTGRSNLCGGESEEEFAWRITRAIWIANEVYCHVEVLATYLEELPYNSYQLDEDEYAKMKQAKQEVTP
jgi:hypothetical protein